MDRIYEIPNIGCLLGMAYQNETVRLSAALTRAEIDITAAEYIILRALFAHGTMQQCDISRILNKDRASVSRSIRSLQGKGLVTVSPVSYKCCMVSISEKTETLKPRIFEVADAVHAQLANRLSPQQMTDLREILETIIR